MLRLRRPQICARLLPAAALLALATACPEPPDTEPPAQPMVTVELVAETTIQLRWTAVGDDGAGGTAAASHELRHLGGAACPITEANFASGTLVSGLGAPQAPGAVESATASGLSADTGYCFMLKVSDEAGNASFSATVNASTADLVAPAQAALSAGAVTDTSVTLSWTAVGDNGSSGTAAGNELRYASGTLCPLTAANFDSAAAASNLPSPAAAGTSQSLTVSGLIPAADYCFALRVVDEAGNSSLSASLAVTTLDSVPPSAAALAVFTVTGSSITLEWTAVGDDGDSGTASSYELRYLTGAACPVTQASFASGTEVSGLPPPSAPGTPESFTVTGLTSDTAHCFMLKVTDDVGNASFSSAASASTLDVTPPDAAALSVSNVSGTTIQFGWLAVGDDGSTGAATSYDLRYATGAGCPLTPATFNGGTPVTGMPAPSAPGTPESASATGLASQTEHCFMLSVADESGNASFSNLVTQATPDVVAPAAAQLSAGVVAATSIQVLWTAVGDDGVTGAATSHDLRYLQGAACPITAANFASGTQVGGLSAPRAAGQPESFIVQGLGSDTGYCFMLQVSDEAGNASLSGELAASTPDVTPPAAASLSAGTVTATSVQILWTAVGDDGAAGTATSYDLRYREGGACPITAANFASGTQAAGLPPPGAAGSSESFTVGGLTTATSYCFMLQVSDEAGNSSLSGELTQTTVDDRPPGPVTDLLASGPDASGAVALTWTAVGNHADVGTAASYELRYQAGECASFDFGAATPVPGLPAPAPSGTPESFTASGLSLFSRYCFGLQVTNDASATSLSNPAAATPDPSAQITAIRDQIHSAAASPVPLSVAVLGGIVTSVKAGVAGALAGDADGPGFFVQNGDTGPALFFALDPAVVLPGVAPGDVVDLAITQGAWLECAVQPCTADASLYAITAATAVPRSSGVALPATQDLTNVALSLPIATGPWAYEHELVSVTGAIGPLSPAAPGFQRAQITTPGTNSTFQQIRITEQVLQERGVIDGCQVTISDTPMWRSGLTAQFAAWSPPELTAFACPALALTSVLPSDGAALVPASDPVAVQFNQPMTPATLGGQVAAGSCSGTVQLSANDFATCVPFTSSGGTLDSFNSRVTFAPAGSLQAVLPYKVRVSGSVSSPNGNSLGSTFTQTLGFTVAGATCTPAPVVISQVYGAGGNTGAPLRNDYVELHNRGTTPVSLSGWSLQYNSATGTAQWIVSALQGTIAPGGYFLVQLSGGANGSPLPTPDWTGSLSLSGTTGRIALMSTTAAIPAGTPCPGPGVVDFVGYGATPLCAEGTPTTALATATAGFRVSTSTGCDDTDDNSLDFVADVPAPRNSSAPASPCTCQW